MRMKATSCPAHGGGQYLIEFIEQPQQPPLPKQPLLRKLIEFNAPELLDGSLKSKEILGRIGAYLFQQKRLKDKYLEANLDQDLYWSLYSLKSMLLKHDLATVTRQVAEHKARMRQWLQEQIEEED
jgi:hypothetical protein